MIVAVLIMPREHHRHEKSHHHHHHRDKSHHKHHKHHLSRSRSRRRHTETGEQEADVQTGTWHGHVRQSRESRGGRREELRQDYCRVLRACNIRDSCQLG